MRFLFSLIALCTPFAALAQQPAQWKYQMRDGVATATYPGDVSIAGSTSAPQTIVGGNPSLDGGLITIAPDGYGTKTDTIEKYSWNGTRSAAHIGRMIQVLDGQSGPISGPEVASYALSLVNNRPDWNTTSLTGEADGLNIGIRNSNGDSAGILSNVFGRVGAFFTIESETGYTDAAGVTQKSVNTQLGVVNSRDGGEYGLVVQSKVGTNLSAGVRIASVPGTSWNNYLEMVSPAGATVGYFRGADGAFIGGSIVPLTNLGANMGGPTNRYATTFTRILSLDMQLFATLPACDASANGQIAYISDASAAITTWGQIVTAGGGANRAYLTCNGTSWKAWSN